MGMQCAKMKGNLASMTESGDITELANDLEARLGEKLGLKRGPLEKRVRKAGRRLPRRVHRDAGVIGKAMQLADHPKLRRRVDRKQVDNAHQRIVEHLGKIDPKERRIHFALGVLSGLAFNILLLIALVIVFLKWRGLA